MLSTVRLICVALIAFTSTSNTFAITTTSIAPPVTSTVEATVVRVDASPGQPNVVEADNDNNDILNSSATKPFCAPKQRLCPRPDYRPQPYACCPLGEDAVCCTARVDPPKCCPVGTTCSANGSTCNTVRKLTIFNRPNDDNEDNIKEVEKKNIVNEVDKNGDNVNKFDNTKENIVESGNNKDIANEVDKNEDIVDKLDEKEHNFIESNNNEYNIIEHQQWEHHQQEHTNNTPESTATKSTPLCILGSDGIFPKIDEQNFPLTLVLGDSISIGYTSALRNDLLGLSTVFHTPLGWAGGAGSVISAVNCIDTFFTNSSSGQPLEFPTNGTFPNVFMFNFGMHDYHESDEVYEFLLTNITRQIFVNLEKYDFRVVYLLTTPLPYNVELDSKITNLNRIAREVMEKEEVSAPGGKMRVVDLHQAIIDRCGAVLPYGPKTCPITSPRMSPHYNGEGYKYLASFVAKAVKDAMSDIRRSVVDVE